MIFLAFQVNLQRIQMPKQKVGDLVRDKEKKKDRKKLLTINKMFVIFNKNLLL